MNNMSRVALAAMVFLTMAGCMNAHARSRITQLHEINIKPGPNQIDLFVSDGRSGLVTLGWRDLGNGVGYRVYSVMIPNSNPLRGWDIVPVEPAASEAQGHEALEVSGSVRFARGWLDGAPATLLITARRDPAASSDPSTPVKMMLDTYRLVTARSGDGAETAFEPVTSALSRHEFCSPDLAIAREFDIAVPSTYTGHNQTDGCPGV